MAHKKHDDVEGVEDEHDKKSPVEDSVDDTLEVDEDDLVESGFAEDDEDKWE